MQFLLKINWAKVWGDRENFYKIWVVRNIEGRTLSSPFDVALALIEANFPASLPSQKQQNLVPDYFQSCKNWFDFKLNLLLLMVKLKKP